MLSCQHLLCKIYELENPGKKIYELEPGVSSQTGSIIISLCPMPDDFTHQGKASRWERVEADFVIIH